ncbi:MAG: DegT/DnrJ/EryC1/StrS family aminotransferase [Candidatus Pacebacteria bacterium]|nr:DegT/DnrJ/EryC1/StrS family aminotransferase [Candidatus Paceibacterota bacterium]
MQKNKPVPLFKVFMPKSVWPPVKKTLFSGYIGQGPKVAEFEKALGKFIGNPLVLTVGTGTAGLQLALRLAGVNQNNEVITTSMTCTATNWPILAAGANPIWADINPETGNIDPASVARLITRKTRAILAVDWAGYPCDYQALKKIARTPEGKKIQIIEDAAHAFGATYKNKKIGQVADFTVFSFGAIKHLTTIEGGAVFVKSKKIYQRGKLLRWYGLDRETPQKDFRCHQDIKDWGYKFNLHDIAATIGLEQLKYVKDNLKIHRSNARFYRQQLKGLKGITLLKEKKDRLSAYWLFTIKVKKLNQFMKYLKDRGIDVSQVHARNDKHSCVRQFKRPLPQLEKFIKEMVSIPVGWWVTKEQREYIVKTIKKFCQA